MQANSLPQKMPSHNRCCIGVDYWLLLDVVHGSELSIQCGCLETQIPEEPASKDTHWAALGLVTYYMSTSYLSLKATSEYSQILAFRVISTPGKALRIELIFIFFLQDFTIVSQGRVCYPLGYSVYFFRAKSLSLPLCFVRGSISYLKDSVQSKLFYIVLLSN